LDLFFALCQVSHATVLIVPYVIDYAEYSESGSNLIKSNGTPNVKELFRVKYRRTLQEKSLHLAFQVLAPSIEFRQELGIAPDEKLLEIHRQGRYSPIFKNYS
jgi:hypothetical protein